MRSLYQYAAWLGFGVSIGLTALALDGYDPGTSGFPSRFTAPDRGEPIRYVVDAQALPAGITTNQMLTAISNACAAWAEVSSAEFEFDGVEPFGADALNAAGAAKDRRIWIQCHNLYGGISNGSPAQGGRWQRWNTNSFPNGGLGGWVGPNAFDEATVGYVMMDHLAAVLTDPVSLEEVVCHELGHALALRTAARISTKATTGSRTR